MKNIAKVISLVLALTLVFVLAACSSAPAATGDDKPSEEKLTLKVATNAEFEPFESLENGEYVGFDIDLINKIAEKLSATVEFNNMEFDAVLAALPSGNCNIGLSGLTINDTRKQSVDFTDPYYEVGQVLIVRADDTIFTGATKEEIDVQLVGKTVGACSGYTGQAYIEGDESWGFSKIEGLEAKIYDNAATGILDLKNDKINALILDDAVALKIVASDANKDDVKVINIPLTVEQYAIAVKKGNTELLSKLNSALAALKESGEIASMLTKWELD